MSPFNEGEIVKAVTSFVKASTRLVDTVIRVLENWEKKTLGE